MVKRDGLADGPVRQAFQGALRKELADFYKLLASLEAQTENAMPDANSPADAPTSYLTLRRLMVWLGEPLVRFWQSGRPVLKGQSLGVIETLQAKKPYLSDFLLA